MKKLVKNTALSILAGSCALCLGGAVALQALPRKANADEEIANTYTAFVDVGATQTAKDADLVIGLTDSSSFTATVGGEVTNGDSLFTSYAVDATYTATVEDGSHTVAVAVIAEEGTEVKVNDAVVALPEGAAGNTVVHTDVTGTSVTVEVTGKLCGALVAPEGSRTAFVAEFPADEVQVISYGKLLKDVLEQVTVYRADGTVEQCMEYDYDSLNAQTGVDLNFTTVKGVGASATVDIDGDPTTEDVVARDYSYSIITMPDDLVYFINCGSYETMDPKFQEENTIDKDYALNQAIFDYYGGQLLNNGIPDQTTTNADKEKWGIYTVHAHNAPGDSTFPYNSMVWTGEDNFGKGATDMGYMLTGLDKDTEYRIWFGTLSHWHGRTSEITFNGEARDSLPIGAQKGYTIYDNVKPDGDGAINIHLTQVGSQNEPTLCFIAVQKMSTPIPAAIPASLSGSTAVGLREHSMTFTGVEKDTKIQIYNSAKPTQLLYEEAVDPEKLGDDGSYLLDWAGDDPDSPRDLFGEGIRKFRAVLVNGRGMSQTPHEVTITDVENWSLTLGETFSTSEATVKLHATADSGIMSWSYRLGEYGVPTETVFDVPETVLDVTFHVPENGEYYVAVTSGNNVTYEEMITVNNFDPNPPAIVFSPVLNGWKEGSYEVALTVDSVSPVVEYALYKDGVEQTRATTAPATLTFEGVGVYTVFVRTSAGQSATSSLRISDVPKTTQVVRTVTSSGARYQFNDVVDGKDTVYKVKEITVYRLGDEVERISVLSGNVIELSRRNGAGTYVANVVTESGEVEMFSFEVTAETLRGGKVGGLSGSAALGIGIGVGVGGLVIAAAAVVVTLLLKKKHL